MSIYISYISTCYIFFKVQFIRNSKVSKYYLALQFLSKQCLLWTLLQLQCCLCQSFNDVAHFMITCIKHLV